MKHRLHISVLVSVLAMGALVVSCETPPTLTVEQSTEEIKATPTLNPAKSLEVKGKPTPPPKALPTITNPSSKPAAVPSPEGSAISVDMLTYKPTPTPEKIESGGTCTLAGGEVVQNGWSGKDTGYNFCNQCRCMDGGLACTKKGCSTGLVPAIKAVLTLTVVEVPSDLPDYDRGDWKHWIDEDKDCQNARHEVLIHESKIDVKFKDDRNCQVAAGEWLDPFTGDTLTDATKLDVDHMVPLKNAHDSGGWAWDKKRKADFANYMVYEDHLIAVTASANRKKGAKGPEGWKPSNKGHWCDYATDWIDIKVKWDLSATKAEWTALQEMLGTCGQAFSITPVPSKAKKPAPEPTSKPVSTTPVALPKSGSSQKVQIASMDCKGKPEIVAISNSGDSHQDMTGWSITDEGVKHTFSFPDGFLLGAGMSVEVMSAGTGDDTQSIIYWKKQHVWNNDGDTATILDSEGNTVAELDCP